MDDQGGGWSISPADRGRLARVEERLETLQEEVAHLTELLRARSELGWRQARGGRSTQTSTAGPPTTPGRRGRPGPALRPLTKPPRDQDPIGCVEVGVGRLGEDVASLRRVAGGPAPGRGPGSAPTSTVQSPATSLGYTTPTSSEEAPLPGDQTDADTGDDLLGDLAPSKGPGPRPDDQERVSPEDERPTFDF